VPLQLRWEHTLLVPPLPWTSWSSFPRLRCFWSGRGRTEGTGR
jgi:hypothetical protein